MNKNKQLIEIALKHLGEGGAKFRKFCGLPSSAAWCNAFVDYAANEGGVSSLFFNGKKETYCPHSIEWCKKNLAQVPPYLAMAGDIIYFDWEKNGVPNHIGLVRAKNSTSSIYTVEGNTDGGKVAKKTRNTKYVQAIYRPHFKPKAVKLCALETESGDFGYVSIANLQRALKKIGVYNGDVHGILGKNTVKGLQKVCGASQDGAWANGTSKKLQEYLKKQGFYNNAVDGEFGKKSIIALKKWINHINKAEPKPAPQPTKAEKITDKIQALAWAYGTAQKKWAYKTGNPKGVMRIAMAKYGYKTRVKQSDCGYCVNTVVREALGGNFKALGKVKEKFPTNSGWAVVHKGKIPDGFLKPGDVIRYKKKKGSQHIMLYYGNGKIAEGGRKTRFFVIRKDEKKYNASNVKLSTVEVLRVKE